jgi:hypothetical protein
MQWRGTEAAFTSTDVTAVEVPMRTTTKRWLTRILPVTAALAATALFAGACASATGGGPHANTMAARPMIDHDAAPDSTPMVRVVNDHPDLMNVYLLGSGQSRFLGILPIADTLRAPVPESMLGASREIRLQARAVGGVASLYSPSVILGPGDVLEWTISP